MIFGGTVGVFPCLIILEIFWRAWILFGGKMWSPRQQLMRLTRSLRSGRSLELPADPAAAVRILMPMVFANQHKSLMELLDNSSFDVNHAIGRSRRTLLHIAANCGQLECVTGLLKVGGDPNAQDIAGCCAIHLAAKNGNKKCVEKLLEAGADPDVADIDGVSSLHWIAVSGRWEILNLILLHTTRIEPEDKQGHTPLHAAARNGHEKVIDILVKAGANANYRNEHSWTPLHAACSNGQRQAVSALLSHNAQVCVDNEGQTPLDLCLQGGYGVAIELLLDKYPKSLTTFINNAVYKHEWSMERVASCVRYFATKSLGREISLKLTEICVDTGFQLLSLSSTCETEESSLLRSTSLLISSLSDDLESCFILFEPLWKALEEWILLLGSKHEGNYGNMIPGMGERVSVLIEVFWKCISTQDGTISTPQRFHDFIVRHHDVINVIITHNPKVIFKHFTFLLHDPILMSYFITTVTSQPFEERYEWFYNCLYEGGVPSTTANPPTLQVRRDKVFEDSCHELKKINQSNLKHKFSVQFSNEEGIGDGVFREWFSVLSNEILNPEYGLFIQSFDGCSFQPNSRSSINPDHLSYFEFAGKILSVALYHKQLINGSLTSSFYKHLLGRKVDYRDVASIDPEYATNLQWILDNDITEIGLELSFVVETDVFGRMEEIELTPGGSKVAVTEENKQEYVQLVTELRMTRAIQPQLDAFIRGFNEIIPSYLIRIFTEDEMDLMFTGCKDVDVGYWKSITEYSGCYNQHHQVILWFWECVGKMDTEDRSSLLHFATGRSRLPSPSVKLSNTFVICNMSSQKNLLPSASTCMSMLRLPEYDSYDVLETKLLTAIRCGSHGYTQT
nr:E3 ubiquitin-protein ligase HACE1-like [Ciona intestinalis]|eukprot:XP_002121858.4 E3 ubiquitin-protein ligase HACE1-like [Ciona intestinalis]